MRISPIDIQQHQFKSGLFGYEKAGVDHFLESVAEELERVHLQGQELREELARTRASLDEMQAREATLRETLLTTQRMTDDLKANARKEAEIAVAEARLHAEKIVRAAEERRLQLIREIQELKRQKVSFETGLRAVVESHLRLLDLDVVALHGGDENHLLEEPLPFEARVEPSRPRQEQGEEFDPEDLG